MLKTISYFILISLAAANQKQNIIDLLDQYNTAFGKADYSDIAKCLIIQRYLIFKIKQLELRKV